MTVEPIKGILHTKDYAHFQIVSPEGEDILSTFEGGALAKGCLWGDTVEWTGTHCKFIERGEHELIVGTLELASRTTYGLTSRGNSIYLFIPYDRRYPPFITGSSERDRSVHRVGLITLESWDIKSQFPRGTLVRLLGPSGDLRTEEEALRWLACPRQSLRANDIPAPAPIRALEADAKRVRITGYTFNIDPPDCRDIDDVISMEQITIDNWRITITIADVATYVEEMSAVDTLAAIHGQTLYCDGEAICPMLPPSISERVCSLVAGEERLGVSLQFQWNRISGTISDIEWLESQLVNDRSFTYDEFERWDDNMRTVLQLVTSSIASETITDSHKWIEVLMKFYNIQSALRLQAIRVGILRKHSAPQMDRIQKYSAWDTSLSRLAQSSAEYCLADATQTTHYGIGCEAYCHATSPIRRYADLMNQRLLKQLVRGINDGLLVTVSVHDLNRSAKVARDYEKNLFYLRALLVGPRKISGRILDIEETKMRIWIPSWQKTVNLRIDKEYDLKEGQIVNLQCALNLLGRHWQERLVVQIE
jgi:exoribonuclease R